MARKQGWTGTVVGLLVGIVGASAFWLFSPYFQDQLANQVVDDLKEERVSMAAKKGVGVMASQAVGPRYQMVAHNQEVFLVDLKEGRVWRYFHQTKAEGFSRDQEGFLPLPLFYAGNKHYQADEIEPPASKSGNQARVGTGENKPQ